VEHDGAIYFGADSAATGGSQVTIRKDKKVFFVQDFLIGCCGSARMRQLLQYALVPPAYDPTMDVERYMVTDFIDAVRQRFKDGGFAQREEEQERAGTFLVGFHKRLFSVMADYQLIEPLDGYYAIGTGDDVALGALFATQNLDMRPQHRIDLALQAAAHLITEVRAPFTVLCTKSKL